MHHHNDNRPRTPAEHRAHVAALSMGQGTQEVRARNRNWPTFASLKRANAWRQISALERFAEDEGVSIPEGLMHAANDNTPVDDTGRSEICRVDSRLDEENPTAEEIAAAAWADEEDRKEGRPEVATRIQFGSHGKINAVNAAIAKLMADYTRRDAADRAA